jgi:hypothetical protein
MPDSDNPDREDGGSILDVLQVRTDVVDVAPPLAAEHIVHIMSNPMTSSKRVIKRISWPLLADSISATFSNMTMLGIPE